MRTSTLIARKYIMKAKSCHPKRKLDSKHKFFDYANEIKIISFNWWHCWSIQTFCWAAIKATSAVLNLVIFIPVMEASETSHKNV